MVTLTLIGWAGAGGDRMTAVGKIGTAVKVLVSISPVRSIGSVRKKLTAMIASDWPRT